MPSHRLGTTTEYREAVRDLSPGDVVLTALEITHPDIAAPVRVVQDTEPHTVGGHEYQALAFRAAAPPDPETGIPRAEIAIDNVGEVLTQWVEASNGGVGASVRMFQFVAGADPRVEWEVTLGVISMHVDSREVRAVIGFEPLFQRRAMRLRHDPQTSPGLF